MAPTGHGRLRACLPVHAAGTLVKQLREQLLPTASWSAHVIVPGASPARQCRALREPVVLGHGLCHCFARTADSHEAEAHKCNGATPMCSSDLTDSQRVDEVDHQPILQIRWYKKRVSAPKLIDAAGLCRW